MENDDLKSGRAAVFDVCDTLYYSNTTHDFIRFVFEGENVSLRKVIYLSLNYRLSPLKYFLIAVSIATGWDGLKKLNVGLLKGRRKKDLEALADKFVQIYLDPRKVGVTHALIADYRARQMNIILCSSSIEPVVRAVAEDLQVSKYLSSTLEYDGEIFSGRIAKDITGIKHKVLMESGISEKIEYAVSDNTSDLELLLDATNAVAIVHNNRKQEFWEGHGIETVDVGS